MINVSIIIPVYNGANYIRQSIDSALNQTYNNIEIIVVDDGSTDNTKEIILGYRDDRVKYFYKNNGGVASALNFAIRESKGDYISWLSHDDLYLPNKIERQIEELTKYSKNTICYSSYELIDGKNNLISAIDVSSKNERRRLNNGLYASIMYYLCGCTLLIPRNVFYDVSFFDEGLKYCQDYDLWIKIFKSKYNLVYIPEVLVQYRIHDNQDSNTKKSIMINEAEDVFINALENFDYFDYNNIFYNQYNVYNLMKYIHKDFPRLIDYIDNKAKEIEVNNRNYIDFHNKISVVIYLEQNSSNLDTLLISIKEQNYSNIELLFITDNRDIIEENIINIFKNIDYTIISFSEKDSIYNHINGNFVQFLRDNDVLLKDKFYIQINEFKNNPHIDISYSKYYTINNKNKKIIPKSNTNYMNNLTQLEDIVFMWNNSLYIPLHSLLIKKEVLKNVSILYNNDYIFMIELAINGYFKFVNYFLSYSYNYNFYQIKNSDINYLSIRLEEYFITKSDLYSIKNRKKIIKLFSINKNFSYIVISFLGVKISIKRGSGFIYNFLSRLSNKE